MILVVIFTLILMGLWATNRVKPKSKPKLKIVYKEPKKDIYKWER